MEGLILDEELDQDDIKVQGENPDTLMQSENLQPVLPQEGT